jgi:hypothetical protein
MVTRVIMNIFVLFILTLSVLPYSFCVLSAEEIIVEGSAGISEDANLARNEAMKNAHQFAINSALYRTYNKELIDQNQFKLMDLYENADSFITSTKILSEEQNMDSQTVDLRLQVDVNIPAIKEYLAEMGIALSSERISTVLPLIAEKASLTDSFSVEKLAFSDVEKTLARSFAQNNFSFINPYFSTQKPVLSGTETEETVIDTNLPKSSSYTELKVADLVKLGRRFNAGIVCSGYVWTNCTSNIALNKTDCETNTSLQLLSTDTSKVLAAKRVQEKDSSSEPEEARTLSRKKAFKAVSDSLLYQMKHNWDKRPAAKFKLVIKGIKNYETYLNVREVLVGKQVSGFNNVVERYQSKDKVVFEGERRGELTQVSREIISKCFAKENINLIQNDENILEIKLKS